MIAEPGFYLTALALAVVALASVTDLISHRIPNKLTAPVAFVGLVLHAWTSGLGGVADGFLGLLVAFFTFLPFYLARWMAAGDVKLLMAVGACLGWRLALLAGLSSLLIGSIVAFVFLCVRGGLWSYLRRYGLMAKCLLLTGRFSYIPPESSETASVRFPYALAIAFGTWVAIYGPGLWSFMRIPILSGG
jgi:prepilin peptidase CpaA